MPTVRLCAEILPTGSRCRQFALKGRAWCRAHHEPYRRELTAHCRKRVAALADADLFTVALMLANTLHGLRAKETPPLHAHAIFDAAATRLEQLLEEQALEALHRTSPAQSDNPHRKNELHIAPMK